jgi:GxxExxY protein
MQENDISKKIIGLAIEVHQALGPGLMENAYKEVLYYKINAAGIEVE